MSNRTRAVGLALAIGGACVALWGPLASDAKGSVGRHRGYVATRGVVLDKNGNAEWAVYAPDETVENGPDKGKFVPGAATRIHLATGDYEGAVVLSGDEVAFAVQQYAALSLQHAGNFELIPRDQFPPPQYKDQDGTDIRLPALGPRTTHVMKLKNANTPPGVDPLLAQFPLEPTAVQLDPVSRKPSHLSYLIQSKPGGGLGRVLYPTSSADKDGIVSYLSAFFSTYDPNDPEDANAPVAWGRCDDINHDKLNNLQFVEHTGRDDLAPFDVCDAWRVKNIWGPIVGATVDSGSRWMMPGADAVYTTAGPPINLAGRYDLDYPYIAMSQFWDTMYVTLNFQPFDVRSQLTARWFHRKKVQGGATLEVNPGAVSAYATNFVGLGYGNILGGQSPMTMAQWGGGLMDTQKWRSVNFGIEVAHTNGFIKYINEQRPGVPLFGERIVSVNENDPLPQSVPPHYGHLPAFPKRSQVAIDLSTGEEALPGAVGPIINRVQVAKADLPAGMALAPDGTPDPIYDADLVQDMGRSDFANTDVHVFGPAGDLVTSRIGLRQMESPGMTCDPSSRVCTVVESNPAAEAAITDFIRNRYPGARYRVVVVNRSTGYIGTGFVKVGSEQLTNGLNSYLIEGNDGPLIKMRPPNLKIEVKRVPTASRPLGNDLCATLAPNEECEQLVGFEGGGLTDDERIVITTTWLDWDGTALPGSLPGFTGRLSRVVDEAKLGPAEATGEQGQAVQQGENGQSKLGQFTISPGKKTQVVRLADPRAYHYYLHVSGANNERCGNAHDDGEKLFESWEYFTQNSPACASFAKGIDDNFDGDAALGHRPGRYVPVLVPVFDAMGTAAAVDLQLNLIRDAALIAAGNNQPPATRKVPKVQPIYRDVYRAEQQFSVFDLPELDTAELVTKYDQTAGTGKTTLSFGYDLNTADDLATLDPFGSAQDAIWSLGFEELLAMVNDHDAKVGTCTAESPPGAHCFHDLETLQLLTPAQQLAEVENAVALLSPQDYLALQLYLGNDRGNALYTDYDLPYPLVSVDVAPIELQRRENLTTFGPGVVPPPPVEEGFHPIRFDVTRPACLTIKARTHAETGGPQATVELFAKASLGPSTYYYVLDGGELSDKGVKGNFTLEFMAETCGTAVDAGSDGESQFKIHRSEIEVTQETLRANRGLGEIVEHDVNILDGSLRLSRQDFSIGGKGPALALMRSYTNLGADADGALGNGWSHSFDLQLVPTSTEETTNQSVPAWVSDLRSKVTPCANGDCIVAQKLFPTGAVQLTGVYVNGTSFRNTGQQHWAAESGRHGELIQHCSPESATADCFEFKSKDGTSYFYDYPGVSALVAGVSDPNPTMLSLSDGLAQRLALFNLRYRQPASQPGQAATGMEAQPVKRIKDRFDYEAKVATDPDGRVQRVTEADGDAEGRSCRFVYDAEGADAPLGCDNPGTGFERLRSVICLENQPSTLSGDPKIKVDYCYDEDGNLASVQRGRHVEHYEYEHEGGSSPDTASEGGNPNLVATVVDNDGLEQRTTYGYRKDVAPHTFTSGALPQPIALFDMVESVTYPPTAPLSGEAKAEITFEYSGMTRTVGDPRGSPHEGRKYTINTLGNPTQIVEAGRKTTTMQWSWDVGSSSCGTTAPGDNQMVSRTVELEEGRFVTTSFAYDAEGNATDECTEVDGASLHTEQTWNDFDQLEHRKDFRGVEESWDYADDGFLDSYTNGAGIRTTYVRSSEHRGRAASETVIGDVTRTTEYHYDAFGNVSSSSIAGVMGTTKMSHHDARSRLDSQTDQLGRETTYEYDTNDNVLFTRLPSVAHAPSPHVVESLEATYDAVGNRKTENDRNGQQLTYHYTARNQVERVVRTTTGLNAGEHSRSFKYDLLGNIRRETDWLGLATHYEYDLGGFREKTIDRLGKVSTTVRDYAGNVVLLTDAGAPALTTRVRYDELNREVWRKPQCEEPDCGEVSTVYPVASEVAGPGVVYSVRVSSPGAAPGSQVTTRSGYDGRGLLLVKVDAYSNRYEWSYDALGRLKRTKDEEGLIITQEYDARGFLTAKRIRGLNEANPGLLTELTPDNVGNVLFTKVARGSAGGDLISAATYDNWDRPITRRAPGSNLENLYYDGEGNVVRHEDAAGRVRDWERDQRGNVVHFYDAEVQSRTAGQASTAGDQGFTLHFQEIDANGNPHRVVNALGVATRYAYDDEERVTSITEADGSSEQRRREFREFDGLGNPHAVTDWRGNATLLTYSGRHNVLTETDPLGRVTTYTYDGQGSQASVKSPRDFVRTSKRDNLGRVTDVFYPNATTLETHNDYDKVGNLRKSRNRRGTVTHVEPDQYLRVDHVSRSVGDTGTLTRIQTNEYDDAGNVIAVTDGNGNRTIYQFNDRNLLWKTILPPVSGESEADRTEVREYTASGALLSVTAPLGSGAPAFVTTYAHDKEDRSISATAAGEVTTSAYDLTGNLRAQTTPEGQPGGKFSGKAKRFEYDDLKRVTRVTDEMGLSTKYAYDAADNLRDVEGPFAGNPGADTPHVGYVYNERVDRLEEHLQYRRVGGALVTRYDGFDGHDNVTHLIDANSNGFTYDYDEYDRRTRAVYPNKPTALNQPQQIDWDFNDDANTVTVTETKRGPSGADIQDVTLERYDLLFDRLESRRQRGHEVSYGYDVNGNRTSVTSPQGTTTYTFDERNRVKTALVGGTTSTYEYYSDGRVRSIARPNGTSTSLAYYATKRVQQITHAFSGGETAVVAYTYDKNGNRTSVGDTSNGLPDVTTFDEYDAANRLVEFTQDGRTTRYGYERYNRHTENVKENGVTQVNKTYTHDELERLNSVTDDAQAPVTVGFAYDDNGNTLTRTISNAPANRVDFQYDSRDQLVRMTRGPPGSEEVLGRYDYDAGGKRTRHVDGERGSVEYLYDDEAVIEEHLTSPGVGDNPPQTRVTRYHYGQDLLAIAESSGTRYYHQDALGSTTQLSDSAGLTTVEYKTDPFGNVRLQEGDTDNRQTFTGQEYDERTGLYYYGARYYDPVVGRFLTQDSYLGDPGTPASLHRYLYAYSNPLRYLDPTGHFVLDGVENSIGDAKKWISKGVSELHEFSDVACKGKGAVCKGLANFAEAAVAVGAGASQLVVSTAELATKGVDYSMSIGAVVVGQVYQNEITEEASKSLIEETSLIGDTVVALSKKETWQEIGSKGANQLVAIRNGDLNALADTSEFLAGFLGGGGGAAKGAAGGANALGTAVKTTMRVGREVAEGAVESSIKMGARLTVESAGARKVISEVAAAAKSSVSKATSATAEALTVAGRRVSSAAAPTARKFLAGMERGGAELGLGSTGGDIGGFAKGFAKGWKGAARGAPGKSLLPGEGAVGTYDDLIAAGSKGDNITPHHIPSDKHMAQHGVSKGEGIAINMEHPHPGSGGRHRQTFTYGTQADLNLTPRQALARGIWDARRIYQADGLYGPEVRSALQEVIRQNRAARRPGFFDK